MKIYCPKCRWEPRPSDRWFCETACRCQWNTFDTGGVCPQCGKQWEETACPACGAWSRHADWYHEEAPDGRCEEDLVIVAE